MKPTILIIRNAAPQDFGGAETYPVSLATILLKNDYSPIIVSRHTTLLEFAHTRKIPTMHGWWWHKQNWNKYGGLFFPIYLAWQLVLTVWYIVLIFRTNASALHPQGRDDFIAATIAGRLTGKSIVWTDHMDLRYIFNDVATPFKNPVGKLVRWAGTLATHVIVISRNERKLIVNHVGSRHKFTSKLRLVHNGVIDRKITHKERKPDDVFSFCLANRMVETKGVKESILAFNSLSRHNPDKNLRLDVYGDGPNIDRYKQLASSNSSIIFHGLAEDAPYRVAQSDVYMLPSYQEGFSMGLLEATMLGMPIIASNVDSNPEIVEDTITGLLVPPKNPQALEKAMRTMLQKTATRQKMGENARKLYEQNFNLEHIVVDQIIPLYKKL